MRLGNGKITAAGRSNGNDISTKSLSPKKKERTNERKKSGKKEKHKNRDLFIKNAGMA